MTEDEELVLQDKIKRLHALRHAQDQTARCGAIGIMYEVASDSGVKVEDFGTITTWFVHDCIERLEKLIEDHVQ